MPKAKFSIGEALGYAWETFKKNWQLFIAVTLISVVISGIQSELNQHNDNFLIWIVLSLVSVLVSIGVLKITLNVYDNQKPEVLDVFRHTKYFWRYLGASILYGLIVAGGLILLIVPGLYWAMKYSMTLNLIVDKDLQIMDAFHKSAEMTKGVIWYLLAFALCCLGIIILGAIALGVGVIIAIPVVGIAGVYVYRHLL